MENEIYISQLRECHKIALSPPSGRRINIQRMGYWWYRFYIKMTYKLNF